MNALLHLLLMREAVIRQANLRIPGEISRGMGRS
jgi:hypothetical protein